MGRICPSGTRLAEGVRRVRFALIVQVSLGYAKTRSGVAPERSMTRPQQPYFIAFVSLLVGTAWACGGADEPVQPSWGDASSATCPNCLVDGGTSPMLVDMAHCTSLDPARCAGEEVELGVAPDQLGAARSADVHAQV